MNRSSIVQKTGAQVESFQPPNDLMAELEGKSRIELCEIIVSLLSLEPLFTAQQIALRSGMNVRDVRKAINAGKIGGGFFCRGPNSKKVAASAVNAWRQSFFVSVPGEPTVK
jgi:hypothetical protein